MFYKLVLENTVLGVDQNEWVLNLPATVGRGSDLDVCIDHDSISRTHCRLALNSDGALTVRDMNSMNGTYVRDEKVQQALVMTGDHLQLGSVTLRVEYTSDTDHGKPVKKRIMDPSVTVPMKLDKLKNSKPEPQPKKKWWQFWN